MSEPVRLDLTTDEALVLFEYLMRTDEAGSLTFEDQAEQRVLWTIQGHLEKQVAAIFAADYAVQLAAARDRVRDPVD